MTTVIRGTDDSASTPALTGTDADTGIFFPAANTMAMSTGGSERVRVDSSGNVGIGTSAPVTKLNLIDALSGGQLLVATNQTNATEKYGTFGTQHYTNAEEPALGMAVQSNATDNIVLMGGALSEFNAATQVRFYTAANNTTVTGSERARIDSSGNLLVGKTSTAFTTTNYGVNLAPNGESNFIVDTVANIIAFNRNSDGDVFKFFRSGNQVGAVSLTATNTTYAISSDYRLKENVQPMTGAITKIAALKPCTYTWKVDGSSGEGFIAHELQAVCPDAVTGEKDAVNEDGSIKPQGIDTSFLVATLTAAIQEQQQMIEKLTAKVAALEAKG